MGVPCPKCERKRSLADDSFNDNSNESSILKQKALDSSNSNSSSVAGKIGCRRKLENNKSSKNGKATGKLNEQAAKQPQIKSKTNETGESKLDDERYDSLVKYQVLDRQVRDFRVKLALLKDKVYTSKENRREMLVKKENSKRAIESIINLVKMIQKLENSEQKENQKSEIVDELSEVAVVAGESADQLIISNGDEQIVASNEVVTTTTDETSLVNEAKSDVEMFDNTILIEEANEAVNNLNNLDALAGLAVAELNEMSLKNSLERQRASAPVNLIEIDIVDNKQLIENELNVEDRRSPNVNELVNEIEIVVKSSNQTTNSNDESSAEDEPPIKKLRLSPVDESMIVEPIAEPIEETIVVVESVVESLVEPLVEPIIVEQVQEEVISQELDDEVSAAIASIAN